MQNFVRVLQSYRITFRKINITMNTLIRSRLSIYRCIANVRYFGSSEIPKNVIADVVSSHSQQENGAVFDKKPFKVNLAPEKNFSWCLCGKSKHQPFCDGTHKYVHFKIKQRPVKFQVEKEGDYFLCNCKQTKNRPFCDGTHKTLT